LAECNGELAGKLIMCDVQIYPGVRICIRSAHLNVKLVCYYVICPQNS